MNTPFMLLPGQVDLLVRSIDRAYARADVLDETATKCFLEGNKERGGFIRHHASMVRDDALALVQELLGNPTTARKVKTDGE